MKCANILCVKFINRNLAVVNRTWLLRVWRLDEVMVWYVQRILSWNGLHILGERGDSSCCVQTDLLYHLGKIR